MSYQQLIIHHLDMEIALNAKNLARPLNSIKVENIYNL